MKKGHEHKVFSYCEALRYIWNNKKQLFSTMSNLQTQNPLSFKVDF